MTTLQEVSNAVRELWDRVSHEIEPPMFCNALAQVCGEIIGEGAPDRELASTFEVICLAAKADPKRVAEILAENADDLKDVGL